MNTMKTSEPKESESRETTRVIDERHAQRYRDGMPFQKVVKKLRTREIVLKPLR